MSTALEHQPGQDLILVVLFSFCELPTNVSQSGSKSVRSPPAGCFFSWKLRVLVSFLMNTSLHSPDSYRQLSKPSVSLFSMRLVVSYEVARQGRFFGCGNSNGLTAAFMLSNLLTSAGFLFLLYLRGSRLSKELTVGAESDASSPPLTKLHHFTLIYPSCLVIRAPNRRNSVTLPFGQTNFRGFRV